MSTILARADAEPSLSVYLYRDTSTAYRHSLLAVHAVSSHSALTCRQRRPQRQRSGGACECRRTRHVHGHQLRLLAAGPHRDGGVLQALRPPRRGAADIWCRQADPAGGSVFEVFEV
jgi:hypothetical protein